MSVLAGVALGATTINPMGLTRDPAELERDYAGLWRNTVEEISQSPMRLATRINLIVGEHDARDSRAAKLIAEAIPGSSVVVVEGAAHNATKPIFKRGEFTKFLVALTSNFSEEKLGTSGLKGIQVTARNKTVDHDKVSNTSFRHPKNTGSGGPLQF